MQNLGDTGYTNYMRPLRFVLPFLFVRNWHDGQWELSRARAILFGAFLTLVVASLVVAYILQAPIIYVQER
jgi:hypothetical protein